MTSDTLKRRWATTPRWAKWALGVSLAINFIIIGVAIGAAARFHKYGHQHGGGASIGQIMRALPSDRRDSARDLMKANRAELKAVRADRRSAHQALAATIAADPFDPAAARAAFAAMRDKDNLAKSAAHEIMVDVLGLLTDEERDEVGARLSRHNKDR